MARFRIDHPDIDVDELEERVRQQIEDKLGRRFSAEELQRLRAARLQPRLRREDLPRGFLAGMSGARAATEPVPPPPGPERSTAVSVDREDGVAAVAIGEALWGSGRGGVKGALLRGVRRLARPLLRTVMNVEQAFEQFRAETVARIEQAEDRQGVRLERSYDRLKDDLDRRVDRTADWAGSQISDLAGTADRRHERELQLLHNLVFELTHARLEIAELQDRLYETRQEMSQARERARTLERMVLGREPGA